MLGAIFMIEVEIKIRLTNEEFSVIPLKFNNMGFTFEQKMRETDYYYDGIDRSFAATDEALRVRISENLNTDSIQAFLTYKGKKLDTISKTRSEYEVAIDNPETMKNVLKCLGFQSSYIIEKIRTYYSYKNLNICIDKVEKVGVFMELENVVTYEIEKDNALKELLQLLEALGIDRSRMERKSYLELYVINNNLDQFI
jgi:adenylate cyclase, class 2